MNHPKQWLTRGNVFFLTAILFLCIVHPSKLWSQTSLKPGDIILVSVNADGNDNFDAVPLVRLSKGTTIKFTDNAYVSGQGLKNNEGIITYTAPKAISPGTVLSYTGSDQNGFKETDGRFNASTSGDNIIIYQTSGTGNKYLYGAGWARGPSVWEYSSSSSTNRSDIPPELSQANHTILSLGTDNNYQYDASNGTKGSKQTILAAVGDENNWNSNNDKAYPAFAGSFSILSPPIIKFKTANDTTSEGAGTKSLSVELAEADGNAVSVEVAFLSDASSASSSDIDSYQTKTVHFNGDDTSGTVQKIAIPINDDNKFEGRETAIFQLQNNSRGNIVKPSVNNLTIMDNDTPPVVINEILADPPDGRNGDANGDGMRSAHDDEFIEIVNKSARDINISGWQLSDDGGSTIRHTFPSGTVLPAGKAAVVFGGGKPSGDFGGAIVQTASTGGLSLNNASDQPTLLDNHGNVVQSVSYGGAGEPAGNEKQSITRNPDITGNFEEHTTADKTDNSLYSPGTKIDGKAFGSNRYAISLRGHEGWRFIASPTQNTTFSDMFSSLWTQGIPGSDAASVSKKSANIYSWHEHNGGGFGAITGMSDQVQPGKGYIIYVYKDDNLRTPGVQGGFPKIIKAGNTENSSPVRVAVNSNDNNGDGKIDNTEGFNLLGNPFSTDISVDAVIKALQNVSPNINHNLYVWDPNAGNGNGAYKALAANGSGHTVAPFQAFFIRYTAGGISGKARFSRQKLAANKGISFVGRAAGEVQTKQGFKMYLGNGHKFDTYSVEFRKHGAVGEDKMDAFKLFSLNANAISFFSTVGDNVKIATNVLPPVSAINGTLHIPLGYKVPKSGQYEIRWSNLKSIPDNLKLYLIDHSADNKINMRTAQDYRFNITKSRTSSKKVNQKIVPSITESTASVTTPGSRFEIVAIPASNKNNKQPQPAKQQTKLSPNYPNPFSSQTSLNLQLKNKVHVKMTIFNIVGQKVAKLVDRTMNAGGPYQITWKVPADMPSGIYICKVTAGRKILTRKMTLVK